MSLEQIIKYEGDNSTFVWKHPIEDFNTGSQLIVHESQEAIFFMNGQALDLFGPGRYTLETQNIPLIGKALNIPTGGITPFHCEVYFVNKTEQMSIRWGTDSKVQYVEPTYQFPLSIGANGDMSLAVEDARKLLLKLVGTETSLSQDGLVRFFRGFLMTRVKTYIAQIMKSNSISIFEIDSQLEQFSDELKTRLGKDFSEYGISLKQFFVTTIAKPDGEPQYERFKELFFKQYADVAEAKIKQQVGIIEQETESRKMVIEAQGIAEKRKTEGYTYQQERGFDVAEKVAENEGAGNFSSAGIGLGMMAGVGGAVGSAVGGVFGNSIDSMTAPNSTQSNSQTQYCDKCGTLLTPGALFCDSCGASVPENNVCTNCGFKFIRPGKYCPKCGQQRGQ
ncbi:SPFH domain-containing protein [Lachnospira multipara]|uniref:SPFH domain-containing protein n=1 Tax=Lachnospira multipara TaxID=28051 RepID=UPI000489A0C9|nr:SPFH domain-containing protein [Lachnospira multipara]